MVALTAQNKFRIGTPREFFNKIGDSLPFPAISSNGRNALHSGRVCDNPRPPIGARSQGAPARRISIGYSPEVRFVDTVLTWPKHAAGLEIKRR